VSRKDRLRAERLLRSVRGPLALGELIKIFEGYTRDSFMLEVLITLRRTGIFQAAPDVVAFVGDLAASVELGRTMPLHTKGTLDKRPEPAALPDVGLP
jgi:hypothetical protein